MGYVASGRKKWNGFAVLLIGRDDSEDVRRVRCSVEMKNWTTADTVNGDAVEQVSLCRSHFDSAENTGEEAGCGVDGEPDPSDVRSDGDAFVRFHKWNETIGRKVKEWWNKKHGSVDFSGEENCPIRGVNQRGSFCGFRPNANWLIPLLRAAHDVCSRGDSDPLAVLVIQADKPSASALGCVDSDDGRRDTADDCFPVHVAISFDGAPRLANVTDEPGRQNDIPLGTGPMAASVPSDCSAMR